MALLPTRHRQTTAARAGFAVGGGALLRNLLRDLVSVRSRRSRVRSRLVGVCPPDLRGLRDLVRTRKGGGREAGGRLRQAVRAWYFLGVEKRYRKSRKSRKSRICI